MLGESSSGLTDSDELNRRRELVIHVLREVWEEFYKWKREDSIYHLSSLNAKEPRDPPSLGVTGTTSVHPVDFSAFDSDDDEFVVETYDRDSPTPTDVKRVKPVQITVPDCIQPYPRYEFCTPLSRNISLENTRYVPFVPYYDDPSFPIREYLKHFDGLAWEKDFKNPDTDLIALEAMRRLHYGHDMTLSQIDELGILPESETLLKEAGQRDLVYWPGTLSGFPSLVPYKKDLTSTQFSIFDTILHDTQNLFCAELGCILSKCKLHPQPSHPLVPQKPLLTSDDMKTMKREPCGEDCYKNFLEEDKDGIRTSMEDIEWTNPNDVTFLKDLLKICPDDSPCDLAYICRKRCYEMFSYRCKLLPDEDILENKLSKMSLKSVKKFRKVRPVFTQKPYNTESFVPIPPCYHAGSCEDNPNCQCYTEKVHCERNCRCSLKCERRWKGCKCKHPRRRTRRNSDDDEYGASSRKRSKQAEKRYEEELGVLCNSPESCACQAAGRECEPELCLGCDARGSKGMPKCQNVLAQHFEPIPIRVQPGSYGLGAFATRSIAKGEIIGEYVGEKIVVRMPDSAHPERKGNITGALQVIQDHTGYNYMFALNDEETLDSARAGNETRFLNHSDTPNCSALMRYVSGEHRILIEALADIKKNEELFLDYGDNYWNRPRHKVVDQDVDSNGSSKSG